MPVRTVSWILVAAITLSLILLFNYWASFQPLSTLAYAGLVTSLIGLANLVVPFRFLGVRKRYAGALILAGGVIAAAAGLCWPAPTIRVAQQTSMLDQIMPEYQFSEHHSLRMHAPPAQVLQAIRESTFGDMRSLHTLLKVRGTVMRREGDASGFSLDRQILEAFSASGYVFGGNDREIVMAGGADMQARRPLQARSLDEYAANRSQGIVKIAYNFIVEDAGGGWSRVRAETRVAVQDKSTRGPAIYWRLIVPGSGLLRRQWLDGIRRRAETATPGPPGSLSPGS